MRNSKSCRFLFITFLLLSGFDTIAQSVGKWDAKTASAWFDKREWLMGENPSKTIVEYDAFGRIIESDSPDTNVVKPQYLQLEQLKPHNSINKIEFAKQYHARKSWWNKAFAFLKETDLANLKPGKYLIDGDNVFATVTEGPPKSEDTTKWESHRNYHDIHYVIRGKEKIGVAPVSSATVFKAYDKTRDIIFYKTKGKYYIADPGNFFIFFPQDAHRPNLRMDREDFVKKLVIKIRR